MRKAVEPHNNASIKSQPGGVAGEAPALGPVAPEIDFGPRDKSRSEMIADLAHDLRTPFISIRGYTKMILEERAGPINSTQREYLSIVAENTNRAIQMLNDLLPLTTSEPGDWETMDVRDLWQKARASLQPHAPATSFRITERIPPEPLLVAGDRQALTEVLAEMLSRTVKFTVPGAEIFVELSRPSKEAVTVRISDSKAEFPAQPADAVLQRANPPEATTADGRENLGIGLSMVREIIRSHGGRISVSNQDVGGAGFVVSLPALEAKRL